MADKLLITALPWRNTGGIVTQEGKAIDVISNNHKIVATVWGHAEHDPKNLQWCTKEEREANAKYLIHACNHFPAMQRVLAELYDLPGMPEDARKVIDATLRKTYLEV